MPLSKFQSDVLRTLAAQRSPDSYIAGGVAINRAGPRFSGDIDIFHDSSDRLEAAAQADADALTGAGYNVRQGKTRTGKREAIVERAGETMQLEWVTDAAFRFFQTQPDDLFGYVLHPVDLAANKASAAADRRVPRDIVDLVTIQETILPVGAVICAAVGKFPGVTPEEMLAEIVRHSRFTAEEFAALATERPVDVPALHRRIRAMLDDVDKFTARLPSDAVAWFSWTATRPCSRTRPPSTSINAIPARRVASGLHRRRSAQRCSSNTDRRRRSRAPAAPDESLRGGGRAGCGHTP